MPINLTAAREALARAQVDPSSPWVERALAEAEKLCDEMEQLRAAATLILAMHTGPPNGVGNWDRAFDQLRKALEGR